MSKIPAEMQDVYNQIRAHPFYDQAGCAFGFTLGYSQTGPVDREKADAWVKSVWHYMYANGPRPKDQSDWPEKVPNETEQ